MKAMSDDNEIVELSDGRRFTRRELQGAAATGETCEQRNMRMEWGCKCHGMTFCPDLVCVGYEDDVPVYVRKNSP
jgi:hypothetical protein